jgi:hypothetical protein
MSFDGFFQRDRPNQVPQVTPSRSMAAFTRTSDVWHPWRDLVLPLTMTGVKPRSTEVRNAARGRSIHRGIQCGLDT